MDTEPIEKGHWRVGAEGVKLDNDTLAELRKYESRYNLILNPGMDLTNQRSFQIGLFILLTVCALGIGYGSFYVPYSYLFAFLVVAIQWYIFYLYEKLRKTMSSFTQEDAALLYFRHKRDILLDVVYIKKVTAVNAIFMFLNIWASRTPDRIFNAGAFTLLGFVALMVVAFIIHYRIKIVPVIVYLNGLVKHLEGDNIELQKG